jgi:parallel beta-helix repeat protein
MGAPIVPEGARIYKIKVKIRAKLINNTVSEAEFTLGYYDGPVAWFEATDTWQDFEAEFYYLKDENDDWKTITQLTLSQNLFSIDYEGPAGGATENLLAISSAYIEAEVVDSIDSSDFFNLNEAIDYLNSIGGGSLFIKNGNYDCGKTYNYLNSYVHIIGESLAGVVLTAYDKDYNLVVGTDGAVEYSTGTITLTQNSSTVLASGVSWTSAKTVGKYLLDKRTGHYYKIASFTDSTHIELEETYQGPTTASLAYVIVPMYTENTVSNLTMTFEVVINKSTNCVVENVNFKACTVRLDYVENLQMIDCDLSNITTAIQPTYLTNSHLINNTFKNFTATCLVLDTNSVGNTLENNLFMDNKGQCLLLSGSNNIIKGNTFLNCGWTLGQLYSAIILMSTSFKNILSNNLLRNVQSYGIGSQAGANYNLCIGNICIDNGQAGIVNNGAQSVSSGNIV